MGRTLRSFLALGAEDSAEACCAALVDFAGEGIQVRISPSTSVPFLVGLGDCGTLAVLPACLPSARRAFVLASLLGQALFIPPLPQAPEPRHPTLQRRHERALQRLHRRSQAFGRAFAGAFLDRIDKDMHPEPEDLNGDPRLRKLQLTVEEMG